MDFSYSTSVVEALEAGNGLHDRGYSFLDAELGETFWSFHRLRTEAGARANKLRALGLRPGDRLALILPEGIDFIPILLGALAAGVVPVPLYPPLSMGKLDAYLAALTALLTKADPVAVCTSRRVEPIVWSVVGKVPSVKTVFTAEDLVPSPAELQGPFELERPAPEQPALLQFTSGSTSLPRGVVVTHGALAANAWGILGDRLEAETSRDVGVSWLPLYHDMGLIGFVLAPLFDRYSVSFLPTLAFVRSPVLWLEALHRKKGTVSFAPNFAFSLITKRVTDEQVRRLDLSHVRALGCGAEPINAGTLRAFAEKLRPAGLRPEALLPSYGMAEATVAISLSRVLRPTRTQRIDLHAYETRREVVPADGPLEGTAEVVGCGKALAGHELAILGPDGKRLADRQVGEVVFRGPSVAQGYFRDPEATERTFGGGWLRTGDLGFLDGGELFVTGRSKDLIIINGRNHDPQRLEWLAEEVAGIRKGSAVAFSRPGPDSEHLVIAAETREVDTAALAARVREHLAGQVQLSAEVVLLQPGVLPKTSSGKPQRQATRAQHLAGTLGEGGVRTVGAGAARLALARRLVIAFWSRVRHRHLKGAVIREAERQTLARGEST